LKTKKINIYLALDNDFDSWILAIYEKSVMKTGDMPETIRFENARLDLKS